MGFCVEIFVRKLEVHSNLSLISLTQHPDFAYVASLIRTFMGIPDSRLDHTKREYTPQFAFKVGKHLIETQRVQTEVDAGHKVRNQVVLIEAKSAGANNTIIHQLYYPFRQWQVYTKKKVHLYFFKKNDIEDFY